MITVPEARAENPCLRADLTKIYMHVCKSTYICSVQSANLANLQIDDLPNLGTSTRRGKRDVEKVEMTLFH